MRGGRAAVVRYVTWGLIADWKWIMVEMSSKFSSGHVLKHHVFVVIRFGTILRQVLKGFPAWWWCTYTYILLAQHHHLLLPHFKNSTNLCFVLFLIQTKVAGFVLSRQTCCGPIFSPFEVSDIILLCIFVLTSNVSDCLFNISQMDTNYDICGYYFDCTQKNPTFYGDVRIYDVS